MLRKAKIATLAGGLICLPLSAAEMANQNAQVVSIETNVQQIRSQFQQLADEYGLTSTQKTQIRVIFANTLPEAMNLLSEMLDNRRQLLESNAGTDVLDETLVQEIASRQGGLLAQGIIMKEHLKKDIRQVLDENQQDILDDLLMELLARRFGGI